MDRVHTIRLEIPQNDNLFAFLYPFMRDLSPLLPHSVIQNSLVQSPLVSFDTQTPDVEQTLQQGNLTFGFNLPATSRSISKYINTDHVDLGEIVQFMRIERIEQALRNTQKSLNHWGINFSPAFIKKSDYLSFRTNLAQRSNLYSYPTGEEWPFLLPSSNQEFKNGIDDESQNRNPKFELVYADYHSDPLIQFDIETELTRPEVERLFPKPYGVSLMGLENQFRSVFIKTHWCGVLLRLDLRFPGKTKDFGYWVAKKGKRL